MEHLHTWVIIGLFSLVFFAVMTFILYKKNIRAKKDALDATAREQALLTQNETLYRMSRMRADFFQNMSHDFKTPLTVISTSLANIEDLIGLESIDKDEIHESILSSQREIMRMSRMLDSALKLSAMEDSNQEKEPMNIARVLREGAEIYHVFLKRRGNALTIRIPQTLPKVYGNEDMILHVLSNLFSNANRHTRNGKITIAAEAKNGFVVVVLADTGSGIPEDMLPKIFERGVSSRSTGLGLSICKTVIEEIHKGRISIKSHPGRGTQVMIELPIYKEEE